MIARDDDPTIWQGGSGNVNICGGTINLGTGTAVSPPKDKAHACPECGRLNWRHANGCTACGLEFHPGRRLAWRAAILLLLAANVAGVSTRFLS